MEEYPSLSVLYFIHSFYPFWHHSLYLFLFRPFLPSVTSTPNTKIYLTSLFPNDTTTELLFVDFSVGTP